MDLYYKAGRRLEMTYFQYLHPATKAIYFGALFIFITVIFNPLSMILTFLGLMLLIKKFQLQSIKELGSFFGILGASIVAINFLFNHRGNYILFYFMDRPMTLESLLYGISSAIMIICIIVLFQCVSNVITTNEFLYLFSGIMPQIGLLISITCGFFQMLTDRGQEIQQAVRMKDIEISNGKVKARAGAGMQIMQVLIALTLENALITVLSMKTRAFNLTKRTNGFEFKFRLRDKILSAIPILILITLIIMWQFKLYSFQIYPSISFEAGIGGNILFYSLNLLLLALPFYKISNYEMKLAIQKEVENEYFRD